MSFFRKLLGIGSGQTSKSLGTGFRCSICSRRIEEGKPTDIGEWYSEWIPQHWFETQIVKCKSCGNFYCSDCSPRFMSFIEGSEFEAKKCSCGASEFEMVPGRQQGSIV